MDNFTSKEQLTQYEQIKQQSQNSSHQNNYEQNKDNNNSEQENGFPHNEAHNQTFLAQNTGSEAKALANISKDFLRRAYPQNDNKEILVKELLENLSGKMKNLLKNAQAQNFGAQNSTPKQLNEDFFSTSQHPTATKENTTQNTVYRALATVEADEPHYFCATPVRTKLRQYLIENCAHLEQDDVLDIINMAKELETSAIESFKKQTEHKQNLINTNKQATNKLCADTTKTYRTELNNAEPFTRKQINDMSIDEFREKRREIFAQYKKGLIK